MTFSTSVSIKVGQRPALIEHSAYSQVLLLPTVLSPKELLIEKVCPLVDALQLYLQKYTPIPLFQ